MKEQSNAVHSLCGFTGYFTYLQGETDCCCIPTSALGLCSLVSETSFGVIGATLWKVTEGQKESEIILSKKRKKSWACVLRLYDYIDEFIGLNAFS